MCIETHPDDTLETSLRNPDLHKQNRSLYDIRIMRKKPANPKYPNISYGPLMPWENQELIHHLTHKRGESGCINDLKYWCEKHGYQMTENRVSTWWTSRIEEAVNKALRSTNRPLQNAANAEFGWPAITEDSGTMKNPQHKYYSNRQ